MNHLWLAGVPSYYGGSVMVQFAMNGKMDDYTVKYLRAALYESGEKELVPSETFTDVGLNWKDPENLKRFRTHEPNTGWQWDIGSNTEEVIGITWGGCLESIDEMLRHGVPIPSLEQFNSVILFIETSEEIPDAAYVHRVIRALGERGILFAVKAILVGRPKAWEFNKQLSPEEKVEYKKKQQEIVTSTVREYNSTIPIIQNMDFGHTDPQICLPYGGEVRIDVQGKRIFATF
jgi:muramoyltetrapeptide carboxypeptidase LdcA involved in peptidoglycan recycling